MRSYGINARGLTFQKEETEGKEFLDVGDMHELPYSNDTFDGIVLWDSLEHAQSPFIALCEARRVVKPKGCGTVFIPGKFWWDCEYHIICPNILQMTHLTNISGWHPYECVDLSTFEEDLKQDQMAIYYMVNE
jgi:ubiquinone/menaquinone biosynthesis C-methylase UbiE